MNKYVYSIILLSLFSICCIAQKRQMEHADFDTWNRIRNEKISTDGKYVVYHLAPGKGDQIMNVTTIQGNELLSLPRAENSTITYDSKHVIFRIKPALDSLNRMRRNKVKKKDLPKDSLGIYNLDNKGVTKISSVKNYKTPKKWGGYLAYQLEEIKAKKDTSKSDSTKAKKPKKKKGKKVNKENGYHLVVMNLENGSQDTIRYVLDYLFAEEGKALMYSTTGVDSTILPGVYHMDLNNGTATPLTRSKGTYKQLALSKDGQQAAFLSDLDTTKTLVRNFQLRYWKAGLDSATVKADNSSTGTPTGWVVNENGNLSFSDNGSRLLFGTSPKPIIQDTTLLPEEIVKVEIWGYKDSRLHTQQNIEVENDKKQSFVAWMSTDNFNIVQVATESVPDVRVDEHVAGDYALGISNLAYQKFISWEGWPRHNDFYLIDLKTGNNTVIAKDVRGNGNISPGGKYSYWYNAEDSIWYTFNNSSQKTVKASEKIPTSMANELMDTPNLPGAYGIAGWTEDDKYLLIYDRYDIWQVDPEGAKGPVNLTNGRSDRMQYRYLDLDREEQSINYKSLLLSAFSEVTRNGGYYELKPGKPLKKLVFDNHRYRRPIKAEKSDEFVFTKENHSTFPDLLASTASFKKVTKLSNANSNMGEYNWGSVELYNWTSLDGIPLEGLLYKPENFDPSKKYPMITYFYERNSNNLNRHWGIVPIRSIVNPAFYASRGYIVFIPDIVYRTGYPGESCYNAVIPGVTQLISEGFVDENKLGVQGHSWGGYQTAYLVTKTNIFAAAEAGAVVSNMISAYGGIRWWTGLSRMFQYEHTQSRIGGTLWEYPMRFIENSPIFYIDKIQTPLLLMHNDADGHVPWYQGIEMYVALRRLGKPSWMLNYNGEPHWPTKWENIRDFNVRMQQFFDHYLKDEPMPKWMAEGVPAVQKGIDPGLELMKE
ncbi:MAG: prolyl oligopeptidase family serine peptidase [Bacteroidota bacterium]